MPASQKAFPCLRLGGSPPSAKDTVTFPPLCFPQVMDKNQWERANDCGVTEGASHRDERHCSCFTDEKRHLVIQIAGKEMRFYLCQVIVRAKTKKTKQNYTPLRRKQG